MVGNKQSVTINAMAYKLVQKESQLGKENIQDIFIFNTSPTFVQIYFKMSFWQRAGWIIVLVISGACVTSLCLHWKEFLYFLFNLRRVTL